MRIPTIFRSPAFGAVRPLPWSEPGAGPNLLRAPRAKAQGGMERRTLIGVLALVSGVTAVAGGLGLMVSPGGSARLPAETVLQHTPFASFFAPGFLLATCIGGTSLLCAALAWRRARGAIEATLVAGGALTVWIL